MLTSTLRNSLFARTCSAELIPNNTMKKILKHLHLPQEFDSDVIYAIGQCEILSVDPDSSDITVLLSLSMDSEIVPYF